MMQQYFNIKKEYTDALLFFRLGDFYEMFFDDALVGSKALEIALTRRDCGNGKKCPMCGIPYGLFTAFFFMVVFGIRPFRGRRVRAEDPFKGAIERRLRFRFFQYRLIRCCIFGYRTNRLLINGVGNGCHFSFFISALRSDLK